MDFLFAFSSSKACRDPIYLDPEPGPSTNGQSQTRMAQAKGDPAMVKRWLLAGIVLASCSFLFVGRALAQAVSYESLRSSLVTTRDIRDTGFSNPSDDQNDLGNGVIQVLRIFTKDTSDGTAV